MSVARTVKHCLHDALVEAIGRATDRCDRLHVCLHGTFFASTYSITTPVQSSIITGDSEWRKRPRPRFDNRVERTATVRSTGCQTGLYNQIDNRLYTRYNRLSNRFDNRLYCVYKHLTGCQIGLTTDLTTGCIV